MYTVLTICVFRPWGELGGLAWALCLWILAFFTSRSVSGRHIGSVVFGRFQTLETWRPIAMGVCDSSGGQNLPWCSLQVKPSTRENQFLSSFFLQSSTSTVNVGFSRPPQRVSWGDWAASAKDFLSAMSSRTLASIDLNCQPCLWINKSTSWHSLTWAFISWVFLVHLLFLRQATLISLINLTSRLPILKNSTLKKNDTLGCEKNSKEFFFFKKTLNFSIVRTNSS